MKFVCISAGMLAPKKGNENYRKQQRYLNYGLLSLASLLPSDTRVYHGGFSDPRAFLGEVAKKIECCDVVLVSVPSFYALEWSVTFSSLLKLKFPKIDLHVGGRWVVDGNKETLLRKFPEGTIFHEGLGEPILHTLDASILNKSTIPRNMSHLDYARLNDFEAFNPSIEISRGCGMGCKFCQEADLPLTRLKSPLELISECSSASNIYGYDPNFYFEASFFAPGQKWIDGVAEQRHKAGSNIMWRSETRADGIPEKRVQSLYDAGMRYLDIGLESADHSQLLAMGKTKDPARYLDRAAGLIETCANVGVKCKINILFYAGETKESISNTTSWLKSLGESVYGVSAYPVLIFGLGEQKRHLQSIFEGQGATGIHDLGIEGITGVNLSESLSHIDAQSEALRLSRQFMDRQRYFELKSFSYFDPRYTIDQFRMDVADIPEHSLPFCGE